MLFEIGGLYNRARDIHAKYGGSHQSGIAPSREHPVIFLFSGQSGERYGYADDWFEGIFLYTGEGQVGDMEFTRGNKALLDHSVDGRDLHLFRALGKGKPYRYEGQFFCTGWEYGQGLDREGSQRRTIVFHLVSADDLLTDRSASNAVQSNDVNDLKILRQRALDAAAPPVQEQPSQGRRNIYQRSADVRAYVLARAGGKCECCGSAAPFLRRDGTAYLEPHHIRRISDGGPDHPRWVAATCPNCHREIHFGVNGQRLNDKLADRVGELETLQHSDES